MSQIFMVTGSIVTERLPPVATVVANPQYGVIGSVVKMDGQQSNDPGELPGRTGRDSSTTVNTSTINAPSGEFTQVDVQRKIVLTGTDAGSYRISSVLSPTSVTVVGLGGELVVFRGGANNTWTIGDSLTYAWRFVTVPIGSSVAVEGFRILDSDGTLVSFSPDIVGEYIVGLTVSNGIFTSSEALAQSSIRAIMVPNARGIVPDGKFIWQYIRDVWQQVEGKEIFEALWSVLTQTVGGELLKLYQNDFNKSIRDIQDLYQRRWLKYEPKLDLALSDLTFFLGDSAAGQSGTTQSLDLQGQGFFLQGASGAEFIVVLGTVNPNPLDAILSIIADSKCPANIHDYQLLALNSARTGYRLQPATTEYPAPVIGQNVVADNLQFQFSFQSTTWTIGFHPVMNYPVALSESPDTPDDLIPLFAGIEGAAGVNAIHVGDVIYYPSGPNAGFYRILNRSGTTFFVDRPPKAAADLGINAVRATVYRPSEFALSGVSESEVSSTFGIPVSESSGLGSIAKGRIITVGGQAYIVLRSTVDSLQPTPMTLIVTDDGQVLTGRNSLNWRAPNTLVSSSQNFEELGVSAGDSLIIDVLNSGTQTASELAVQVVGVDGNRLGFVWSDVPPDSGVVPPIPTSFILQLANDFGIKGVTQNPDGTLSYSSDAASIVSVISSLSFARTYFNTELPPTTAFSAAGGTFYIHPKAVIRNQRVPVDETLISIPGLQDWLVQPTISQHDGKYFQAVRGQEFPLTTLPVNLVENSDYIIDSEEAFSGEMTFQTGSNVISVDDGHFIDRGLVPGDSFEIVEPESLAEGNPYYITAVLSPTEIELNKVMPLYQLGDFVTAKVRIIRKSTGHFLRFIPGGFTVKSPAPARFWAEVSFFDNGENIENNFGILVALTRQDLTNISSDINYRQAVAGLMFAYTNGSVISKIRLGAQILLGLPYAEHQGIIRSIENDYRLNSAGVAILGRILVEDTDQQGNPQGLMRVYTFPVDPVSDLAGIDTNPDTNLPYAVGDSVQLFASLSKGVEINDYLTQPDAAMSSIQRLQQYHTARLRANDSIFTIDELNLVSTFFKRITPSYIALVMTTTSEVEDTVDISDRIFINIASGVGALVDNPFTRVPSALMFDGITMAGRPVMFSEEGLFFPRLEGENLTTTLGATTATIPGATMLSPAGEDGARVRPGDFLFVYGGPSSGLYPIIAVPSDTQVTVSGLPASGFQANVGPFLILRQVQGLVRSGAYTSDGTTVSVEAGLHADTVAPGDLFITDSGFAATISRVGASAAGSTSSSAPVAYNLVPHSGGGGYDLVPTSPPAGPTTTPFGALPVGALTTDIPVPAGSGSYLIIRESFLTSPITNDWAQVSITSDGTKYTAISGTSGSYFKGLVRPGDFLLVGTPQISLMALDPINLVFTPVLPSGTYSARIARKESGSSEITTTSIESWDPQDVAIISLNDTDPSAAVCSPGVDEVVLQAEDPGDLNILPGDLLKLTAGGNSTVDVGYGPGVFPIVGVTSSHVTLALPLPSGDDSPWSIIRRR